MKNRLLIAAAAAAILLASCGAVEDDSSVKDTPSKASDISSQAEASESLSEDTSGAAQQEESSAENSESTPDEQSSSETDSSETTQADISGYYIESVNGNDENYIIVSDTGSFIIKIGEASSVPITVEQTDGVLSINRGGVSDVTETSSVTYGDGTVTFEQNGRAYLWRKIDFIPLSGTYNRVDGEGNNIEQWVFNGDGTGSVTGADSETSVAMRYSQTADSLEISLGSDDDNTVYSYTYNVLRLDMTDGSSAITLVAANS
ncbi:MAG: hypothetical protein ACI4JA_08940 [Oscillospiraceae bacterium]